MRIISKFHDYYDSVQIYGTNKDCVFLRKTEDINKNILALDKIYNTLPRCSDNVMELTPFIVVICGDVCIGYKFSKKLTRSHCANDTAVEYLYSESHITDALKFNESIYTGYLEQGIPTRYWSMRYFSKSLITDIYKPKHKIKTNIPIVYYIENERYDDPTIKSNIQLKGIDFYRCMDAYTIYQKLNMFIDGVLTSTKVTNQIPDSTKIAKHGFDEWSFRKKSKNK